MICVEYGCVIEPASLFRPHIVHDCSLKARQAFLKFENLRVLITRVDDVLLDEVFHKRADTESLCTLYARYNGFQSRLGSKSGNFPLPVITPARRRPQAHGGVAVHAHELHNCVHLVRIYRHPQVVSVKNVTL